MTAQRHPAQPVLPLLQDIEPDATDKLITQLREEIARLTGQVCELQAAAQQNSPATPLLAKLHGERDRAFHERGLLENNIAAFLERCERRPCKRCGVLIGILYTHTGQNEFTQIAVNYDLSLHTKTCARREGANSNA